VETKVQWGSSLGVRISGSVAAGANLTPGTSVQISTEDDAIVIRAVARPKYRLADLLRRVRRTNLHDEVDTGAPLALRS
jgi:antitoxin component of MazEF toxin-antitoxin module